MASHPGPGGPRERKAIKTLLSAKAVAVEVENLRRRLSGRHLTLAETSRLQVQENEALARLCNLISLALAEINESADGQFRARFDSVLGEVRGRLLELNFDQMVEKLGSIHAEALDSLQTEVYRLGLAARLERSYAQVLDNLVAMGATEEGRLGAESLQAVVDDIKTLAEIERSVFRLVDFDAEPPTGSSPG